MSAWQQVVDRLVTHLPTLPGWSEVAVYDGPPVTQDVPTDYVTVGFRVGEEVGGSFEQTRPGAWDVEEEGTVTCEVVCTTGEADIAAVRARAFDLFDAWQEWVTAAPTLGVLEPSSTASLAVDVQPIQTTDGATQRLTVTCTYLARF